MKPSLDKSKVSFSFSDRDRPAVPGYLFYEHYWDGPRRLHVPVWQPRQTTLVVVFDGASRHLFSTARILLYYSNSSPKDARAGNVWDIQQLGSVIHSFKGQVQNRIPNPSTLPALTIAFEVVVGQAASKSSVGILVLRSPTTVQEFRRSSITVLLERELPLTADTLSLSLSFTHSTMLCTPIACGNPEQQSLLTHPASRIELVTTRIVRVLPPDTGRPRITNGCLPTELLVKTFKDAEFRHSWPDDLLVFAQVCRAWTCAMDVLHARLPFSDDDLWRRSRPRVDVYALAQALRDKPSLAHDFRYLTTDNFGVYGEREDDDDDDDDPFQFGVPPRAHESPARYTAALITILGATTHVQHVHLGQLDPAQADALFSVLHELDGLRTLSIGAVAETRPIPVHPPTPTPYTRANGHPQGQGLMGGLLTGTRPPRLLSVVQLARCMARWPHLTALKIRHLHPSVVPGLWRLALRPPTCKLTRLTLTRSHLSDRDLVHLFASPGGSAGTGIDMVPKPSRRRAPSASPLPTLTHLVLDRVEGLTNAGLIAFLRTVAPSLQSLVVRDVALPPAHAWGNLVIGRTERALDVVVPTMLRLQALRIGGDVASEFMLDRRSRVFVAQRARSGGEEQQVSVVKLWIEDVPRLCGFAADAKWPGWTTPGKTPRR